MRHGLLCFLNSFQPKQYKFVEETAKIVSCISLSRVYFYSKSTLSQRELSLPTKMQYRLAIILEFWWYLSKQYCTVRNHQMLIFSWQNNISSRYYFAMKIPFPCLRTLSRWGTYLRVSVLCHKNINRKLKNAWDGWLGLLNAKFLLIKTFRNEKSALDLPQNDLN